MKFKNKKTEVVIETASVLFGDWEQIGSSKKETSKKEKIIEKENNKKGK